VEAHTAYSWYLISRKRFDAAIAEARIALDLDPLSAMAGTNLGWVLSMAGRQDEALEQYRRTLEVSPEFLFAKACMSAAYAYKGMHEESIRILKEWTWSEVHLAIGYAEAGKFEEARKLLARIEAGTETGHYPATEIGYVYLIMGDREAGYQWIEKAARDRDNKLIYLRTFLQGERLFAEPRCAALLERFGLKL
jgi:tetratricopeptide (TPR) repeat protein